MQPAVTNTPGEPAILTAGIILKGVAGSVGLLITKFWFLIFPIGLGFFIFAKYSKFPRIPGDMSRYVYNKKVYLLSKPEHELFNILVSLFSNQFYVFPQIHLDRIIEHKTPGQSKFGAFHHINQKSVDFVICDKAYIEPLLAIELDDSTHEREDRVQRDATVENILSNAGLPLVRIDIQDRFKSEEIKQRILEAMK